MVTRRDLTSLWRGSPFMEPDRDHHRVGVVSMFWHPTILHGPDQLHRRRSSSSDSPPTTPNASGRWHCKPKAMAELAARLSVTGALMLYLDFLRPLSVSYPSHHGWKRQPTLITTCIFRSLKMLRQRPYWRSFPFASVTVTVRKKGTLDAISLNRVFHPRHMNTCGPPGSNDQSCRNHRARGGAHNIAPTPVR